MEDVNPPLALPIWAPPIWAPTHSNTENSSMRPSKETSKQYKRLRVLGKINEGKTALRRAANGGHFRIIQLLISHNTDVDRRDVSPVGPKTALHIAAHNKHVAIVQKLLQNGADMTTRGKVRGPLLNFVLWLKRSISNKNYEIIDLILNQKVKLHQAAEIKDLKLIRFLVDHGADCNYIIPTNKNCTVLRNTVIFNQIDACQLVIKVKAQVSPSAFAQNSSIDMVKLLNTHLSQSDISTSGILNYASEPSFILEALLEFNADAHVRGSQVVSGLKFNSDTPSPLIRLALYDGNKPDTEIFKVLVKIGVDVNTINSKHNTALHHFAMQNMHIRSPRETLTTFQLLMKAGTLTNLINSQGKSCLELFSSSAKFRETVDEVLLTTV
ncbi:ankyrin repeat-containing domain protein [Talaromyces proteolyticus]|uniref:Ankyrin repeat-containing domain protein n=1 Tax=Talaromyces proteolyticus TaxID=1131652 RepID=A0AAD4KDJ1_9EURO|nr:ankyrin repeat-containing domain protein [Talaromyces proteolyticus]KAH8689601.1 ankyrin repeat-containing domain protein [Talaromyces proteolyticus]